MTENPLPENLPLPATGSAAPSARWRMAGRIVLGLGLLAACLNFFLSPAEWREPANSYAVAGGQTFAGAFDAAAREKYELQRIGGTQAVLTVELHEWLLSLWHGRRLSYTLVVSSLLLAWLCFHVAGLVETDHDNPG